MPVLEIPVPKWQHGKAPVKVGGKGNLNQPEHSGLVRPNEKKGTKGQRERRPGKGLSSSGSHMSGMQQNETLKWTGMGGGKANMYMEWQKKKKG